MTGNLPWQGLQDTMNIVERYKTIGEIKFKTSPETLATLSQQKNPIFGNLKPFADYLKYARNLRFADKPDYDYLKKLLLNCFKEHKINNDGRFDWSSGPHGGQSRVTGHTATNTPVHGSATPGGLQ